MPEGHTVHRVAGQLGELLGRPLAASSPQGRFEDGASELDGTKLVSVEAYGKHLVAETSSGRFLHVHLGMAGWWLRYDDPAGPGLPQARLRLAADSVAWELVAPSRCELLDEPGVTRLLDRLGPDLLRPDADPVAAQAAMRAGRGSIAAALLDQSVIAGVGNVFRCEALHALGISPLRPCRELTEADAEALWATLQQMMRRGVEEGRIITVDAEDRLALPDAEARRVYKQERCRDCGAEIVTTQVGGRTSYHCPVEQPR